MLFQIQAFCVSLDKTMLVSHAIGERDQLLPVIKHKFAAGPQICTEVLLTWSRSDHYVPGVPDVTALCLYFCGMQGIYFAWLVKIKPCSMASRGMVLGRNEDLCKIMHPPEVMRRKLVIILRRLQSGKLAFMVLVFQNCPCTVGFG